MATGQAPDVQTLRRSRSNGALAPAQTPTFVILSGGGYDASSAARTPSTREGAGRWAMRTQPPRGCTTQCRPSVAGVPRNVVSPRSRTDLRGGDPISATGGSRTPKDYPRVMVTCQASAPAGSMVTSRTVGSMESTVQPSSKDARISASAIRRGPQSPGWRSLKQSMW